MTIRGRSGTIDTVIISARPDRLEEFCDEADAQARLTSGEAADLGTAIDAFRATAGWSDWVDDVPPLDIDVSAIAGLLSGLAEQVDGFRVALEGADSGIDVDGRRLVIAPWFAAPWDGLDGDWDGPIVVEDGGRSILVGTVDAEHVRLERSDGGWVAVVTTMGPSGDPVTTRVPITDAQASNLVIHVSDGNDVVEVPADTTLSFTIWGGDGDDLLGAGRTNPMTGVGGGGDDTIFGGAGDDVINGGAGADVVYGGAGMDAVDGQDGDDTLFGGGGSDQIHGGRGADSIHGGSGGDLGEGGSGDDEVDGGTGDDIVSGGRGDDRLLGGEGDDRMFGGRGDDDLFGGFGNDTGTDEDGTRRLGIESHVTIELVGDPGSTALEFVRPDWMTDVEWDAYLEKIDSDIEFIRSTETGRIGLIALDDAAADSDSGWKFWDRDRRVRIVPYGDDDGVFEIDPDGSGPEGERPYAHTDWLGGRTNPQGSYASPPGNALEHDGLVNIATSRPGIYDEFLPSSTVLYHELAHSYDQISGGTPGGTYEEHWTDPATGDPLLDGSGAPIVDEFRNAEWNSVGHDVDGDGTFDTLETGGGRDHPGALTENAMRDELGLPRRDSYGFPRPGGEVDFRETEVD